MGVPVSLILIAVGAILAFAVHQDPNPAVDIDVACEQTRQVRQVEPTSEETSNLPCTKRERRLIRLLLPGN